jgi:hypothetical protein
LQENLGFEKRICAGFGIVVTTWVAVLLTILLGCRPFKKNWQIYPDPGSKSFASFLTMPLSRT